MQTEKRIAELQNEVVSLKSSYPIASSLVRFVKSISSIYSISVDAWETGVIRIKFTSDDIGDIVFTTMAAEVSVQPDMSALYSRISYCMEPQTGDGSVVLKVTIGVSPENETFYVRVTSIGSSNGTFTKL